MAADEQEFFRRNEEASSGLFGAFYFIKLDEIGLFMGSQFRNSQPGEEAKGGGREEAEAGHGVAEAIHHISSPFGCHMR